MAKIRSTDLVSFMAQNGWNFRLNECDDALEVNGKPMSDAIWSAIRVKLRDSGYGRFLIAAQDAAWDEGLRKHYHPVREYLDGLRWDGAWHIAELGKHFQDTHGVFGVHLRYWLIGAVARAYTGVHNYTLVLDGAQGCGKSVFAKWLCPLSGFYSDAPLLPDDKDCAMLALRSWVWELSEIGAITKRADVEALKGFLSREVFRLRPAFNRFEVIKPGLASFIGTANDGGGLFGDSTGSRRFLTTTVTQIDWNYTQLDASQVWAEAVDAYRAGESWRLSADEARQAAEINADYLFTDPVELLLRKQFKASDPANLVLWTTTADILQELQTAGLGTNATANAMKIACTMKRLGFAKDRRGGIWGYVGVG